MWCTFMIGSELEDCEVAPLQPATVKWNRKPRPLNYSFKSQNQWSADVDWIVSTFQATKDKVKRPLGGGKTGNWSSQFRKKIILC